ncbi:MULTISPECIES: hypothetical protein [Paraburkholderia]|uniref:hypothetical protein n=1 Tax=Paraburkholderia TaxID=1822464 RepID=UPI001655CB53|nr:hypothetical protein [Paraburkholderia podalyriae]
MGQGRIRIRRDLLGQPLGLGHAFTEQREERALFMPRQRHDGVSSDGHHFHERALPGQRDSVVACKPIGSGAQIAGQCGMQSEYGVTDASGQTGGFEALQAFARGGAIEGLSDAFRHHGEKHHVNAALVQAQRIEQRLEGIRQPFLDEA